MPEPGERPIEPPKRGISDRLHDLNDTLNDLTLRAGEAIGSRIVGAAELGVKAVGAIVRTTDIGDPNSGFNALKNVALLAGGAAAVAYGAETYLSDGEGGSSEPRTETAAPEVIFIEDDQSGNDDPGENDQDVDRRALVLTFPGIEDADGVDIGRILFGKNVDAETFVISSCSSETSVVSRLEIEPGDDGEPDTIDLSDFTQSADRLSLARRLAEEPAALVLQQTGSIAVCNFGTDEWGRPYPFAETDAERALVVEAFGLDDRFLEPRD